MHIVLDIVLIILFVVVALIGYLRGFARSVWNVITLALSAFLAYRFGGTVGKELFLKLWQKLREEQQISALLAGICGYILIFLGTVLVMAILGFFLKKLARSKVLSGIDSFFGLLVGLVCGFILVWFTCVVISFLIELNLSSVKMDALVQIAEESVIFRFFCDFSPFEYIHIKGLL